MSTTTAPASSRLPAYLALVGGALAMGISPIFIRVAEVGPFAGAFWRVFLALPVLYLWMRREAASKPAGNALWTKAALLSGLMFFGDLFFWHWAVQSTTIANATFFATMTPVWIVAVGFLFFGKKPFSHELVGVALCIAGGVAILSNTMSAAQDRLDGDLFAIATGFFFAMYFLTVEAARKVTGAARVTFEVTVICIVLLFVVTVVTQDKFLPDTWQGYAALLGMGLISHAAGQGFLSIALGRLPALFSSLVIFMEAVAAMILAYVILGEAAGPMQLLGGFLICLGIFVGRPRD
jgi:drug/metabolite transporter (DMT)-like permease